jgi:hypothetical protein
MKKLISILGSLKVAIVLIVSLGILLSVSTFLESLHGTPFAQKVFYTSKWFDFFLGLFWINIFCSTLSRWPFQKKHIGFVITHVGILVLLIGALLSRVLGVEGQMTLFEGEQKNHMLQNTIEEEKPAWVEGGLKDPINRAAQVHLSSQAVGADETFWLVEKDTEDPHSFFKQVGPAYFELKIVGATGRSPLLTITQQSTNKKFEIPIPPPTTDPIPLGDSGLTVSNMRYYPHARVVEKKLVNDPKSVRFNPALEFEVTDASGGAEHHTKFSLFPEFNSLRGGASQNVFDLSVSFQAPLPEAFEKPKAPSFILSVSEAGPWRYEATSSKNPMAQGEIKLGEPIAAGWMDFQVTVKSVLTRAKNNQSFPSKIPLPFVLRLKDFRKIDYPGTQNPAAYESDVMLHDHVERLTLEKTIRMNKPLDYKGYRVFQASYIQDPELGEASVFTIAKNPGIFLIYLGACTILVGVIFLFYLHPFFSGNP